MTRDSNLVPTTKEQVYLVDEAAPVGEKCSMSSMRVMDKLFTMNMVDRVKNAVHILGTARVLFLVDQNRDLMQIDEQYQRVLIGGKLTTAYSFSYDKPEKRVTVFYDSMMLKGASLSGSSVVIPLQVNIKQFKEQTPITVTYTFNQVKIDLDTRGGRGMEQSMKYVNSEFNVDDIVLEEFNLPNWASCSAAKDSMNGPQGRLPVEFPLRSVEPSTKQFRVSFEASVIKSKFSEPYHLFVAYESQLKSLRVDKTNKKRRSTMLANYQLDKLYHVIRRLVDPESDRLISRILDVDERRGGKSGPEWEDADDKDDNNNNNYKNNMVSCTVSKALPIGPAGESRLGIGSLLLGEEKFLYTGRALIRGQQVRVYEAFDTRLPLWYDTPLLYSRKASDGQYDGSYSWLGSYERQRKLLKTVVYVSEDMERPMLLEMLVLSRDPPRSQLERVLVKLFDFDWQLRVESADGKRADELFSLADECSASVAGGAGRQTVGDHFGRLELLLAGEADEDKLEWLRSEPRRHIAILDTLQTHHALPASMVAHLETSLHSRPLGSQRCSLLLPVAFSLVELGGRVAEPLLLGWGSVEPSASFKRPDLGGPLRAQASVQSCFQLAAHSRQPLVHFGYHFDRQLCYLDLRPEAEVAGAANNSSRSLFRLTQKSAPNEEQEPRDPELMPIFELDRRASGGEPVSGGGGGPASGWPASGGLASGGWAASVQSVRAEGRFSLHFRRTARTKEGLPFFSDERVDFMVRSAELAEGDESARAQRVSPGEKAPLLTGDRFVGLALPVDLQAPEVAGLGGGQPNRVLREQRVEPDQWVAGGGAGRGFTAPMSVEQCRTGCLRELQCGAFSFCVRGAHTECVLSEWDLSSAGVQRQLAALVASDGDRNKYYRAANGSASSDKLVELKTEGGAQSQSRVVLRRQANCELHRKNHLQLFGAGERARSNLRELSAVRVAHREQCARHCFERTLSALRASQAAPAGPPEAAHPLAQSEARGRQVALARQSLASVCRGFFYLDAGHLGRLDAHSQSLLAKQLDLAASSSLDPLAPSSPDKDEAHLSSDVCLLAGGSATPLREISTLGEADLGAQPAGLELEWRPFEFAHLFERHYGVQLAGSPKTDQESRAYARLRAAHVAGAPVDQEALETMERFVERLGNTQLDLQANYAQCAAACFLQTHFLWPACRSFDVAMYTYQDKGFLMCHLNTVSLKQLLQNEQFQLIKDASQASGPNAKLRVWHFDPRPGLVGELMRAEGKAAEREAELLQSSQLAAGHSFGLLDLLAALVALTLGAMAALQLANWLDLSSGPFAPAEDQLQLGEPDTEPETEAEANQAPKRSQLAAQLPGERRSAPTGRRRASSVGKPQRPASIEFRNLVSFEGTIAEGSSPGRPEDVERPG